MKSSVYRSLKLRVIRARLDAGEDPGAAAGDQDLQGGDLDLRLPSPPHHTDRVGRASRGRPQGTGRRYPRNTHFGRHDGQVYLAPGTSPSIEEVDLSTRRISLAGRGPRPVVESANGEVRAGAGEAPSR